MRINLQLVCVLLMQKEELEIHGLVINHMN